MIFFALFFVLGLVFREPLEEYGRILIKRFGYLGIAAGIFAADGFTMPVPPDFYLFVGVSGGANPWIVIAAGSAASIAGGIVSYAIGMTFSRGFFRRHFPNAQKEGTRLVNRLGVAAVVLAALTPLPFSVICVIAGSARMKFSTFLLASLFRVPRMIIFFFLIDVAWGA